MEAHPGGGRTETLRDHARRQSLGAGLHEGAERGEAIGMGEGGKRRTSEKIGRFGLGFNAVYNLTDLPSIVSSDVALFLDPHVHHLQGMGATVVKPGIKLRFLKVDVLEKFRDQFLPYTGLFDCSFKAAFDGTLFRLPFRTAETAAKSEISSLAMDETRAQQLFAQIRREVHQWFPRAPATRETRARRKSGGKRVRPN